MSIKFKLKDYLESLLKEESQIKFCQDLVVKENSVEIKTSRIFASFKFPYLSACLEKADLLIIETFGFNAGTSEIEDNVDEIMIDANISSLCTFDRKISDSENDKNVKQFSMEELICSVCSKIFTDKSKLNDHILRRHTKSFDCSECDLTFPNKSDLNKHSVVHSKEHSLKCDICNLKIKHMRNFKRHMETHSTEIKCVTCNVCGKFFRYKDNLKLHMNIHDNVKFSCGKCLKSYSCRFNLARHKC